MSPSEFAFDWEWLPPFTSDSAEAATFSALEIRVHGRAATELEDLQSQTLRDSMLVSAYPLAMFLAGNWWRLRWEPPPALVTADWRMSHSLAAVGGGYAWPDLTLASDGGSVRVTAKPGPGSPTAPVRYVAELSAWIPAAVFESAVTGFLDGVIARLDALGMRETELAAVWAEVQAERADPAAARWRRLEALAGYDPDEAPGALVEGLLRAAEGVGGGAVDELAAASGGRALDDLETLRQALRSGERCRVAELDRLRREWHAEAPAGPAAPWQRAARAAALARAVWALGSGPLGNARLSELAEISQAALEGPPSGAPSAVPYSAGEWDDNGDAMRIVLHRRPVTSRRFAFCRLVGDRLYAEPTDRLHAATDARTDRQKFQRAFAQELLCPFEALRKFLDVDVPGDDDIEEAAEQFQVSPLVVRTALVNSHVLPVEVLDEQH